MGRWTNRRRRGGEQTPEVRFPAHPHPVLVMIFVLAVAAGSVWALRDVTPDYRGMTG
jgi:hypothetical protein